ncbi:MAG: rhomboid family intramembrane serine protease, partial [Desulfobacteraceae bacterium]
MIPLRDDIPARATPVVTHVLIAVNVAVFFVQASQGPHLDRFIYIYGLVPARYFVPQIADYFSTGQQLFALLSFMFLHGGIWHLLGNMWSLYIFGDNVEDRLGPLRYAAFYLLSGLLSGLAHLLIYRTSNIP